MEKGESGGMARKQEGGEAGAIAMEAYRDEQ